MADEPIDFIFQEKKATQAAALIIRRKGGHCEYLSLVKLLYILDREAIKSWGSAITGGPYFALPHGPVNSLVMDVANEKVASAHWSTSIKKTGNDLSLENDPGDDELSEAETDLIEFVFEQYGHLSAAALRGLTHQFPEWHDPGASRIPISGNEILHAVGRSEKEIAAISADRIEMNSLRTHLER